MTNVVRHRLSALAAGLVVLAASGCAAPMAGSGGTAAGQSVPGGGTVSGGPSSSGPSSSGPDSSGPDSSGPDSSGPGPSTGGTEVNPQEFYDKVRTGNAGVHSALGRLDLQAGGVNFTASFSETLDTGKVTGIDMNMKITQSGQTLDIRVLAVDGKLFVANDQLMQQLGASDKKWALATKDSANSTLQTFAVQMQDSLNSAGTDNYTELANLAKSVKFEGDERRQNVAAHKYLVTVDVAKGASSGGSVADNMRKLSAAGISELPLTMWLDDQGRIVEADYSVTAGGTEAKVAFALNSYNSGVTITVPNDADVFTG